MRELSIVERDEQPGLAPLFVQYVGRSEPQSAFLHLPPQGDPAWVIDRGQGLPAEGDLVSVPARITSGAAFEIYAWAKVLNDRDTARAQVLAKVEELVAGLDPYRDLTRVVRLESFVDHMSAGMNPRCTDEQIALDVDMAIESNHWEGAAHTFTQAEAVAALIHEREQLREEHFTRWLADRLRGTSPTE